MFKVQIILGSSRQGRQGEKVAAWIRGLAARHPDFDVEVLDLREWNLPFFDEDMGRIDFRNPQWSHPAVGAWKARLAEADGYVIVGGEYSHSMSAILKNALDYAAPSMRNKPAAFVAYGNGPAGGARAVEHLALVAIDLELVPLRNSVLIPFVQGAFGPDGNPVNPITEWAARNLLQDLGWWTKHLRRARDEGELPHLYFRAPAPLPAPAGD